MTRNRKSPRGITGQSGVGLPRLAEQFTPLEIRTIAKRYRDAIANLASADAYWCAERRCVVYRSSSTTRHFQLPGNVVWVGTYAHPFSAPAFLEDLEDVLARLQIQALTKLPV